jgi:DHA2 family multidrug resistance protein
MGMAFIFVPLTTLTMDPIPKAETGFATSLYRVMRNVGSSVGVSFVTTFVARWSQFHQSVLAANVGRHQVQVRGFCGVLARCLSFIEAFRVMGILFLVIVPLVLLMRRSRLKRPEAVAE